MENSSLEAERDVILLILVILRSRILRVLHGLVHDIHPVHEGNKVRELRSSGSMCVLGFFIYICIDVVLREIPGCGGGFFFTFFSTEYRKR